MVVYSASVLDSMIQMCKENNVITIADEVFTGFGRTGKFFASDNLLQKADVVCLSKGLTGGVLPMGLTLATEDIYQAFLSEEKIKTFFHGHSFTANPIACAAVLANLELFKDGKVFENIERITLQHASFATQLQDNLIIKEVRQLGTILAIELMSVAESGYLDEIKDYLYPFFLSKKIVIRPLGNVIYLVPPYCLTDNDLNYIYQAILECLTKLANGSLNREYLKQWTEG
jgi:adenosylmethionine---8-amino-7-oxononanoate aminotransferase